MILVSQERNFLFTLYGQGPFQNVQTPMLISRFCRGMGVGNLQVWLIIITSFQWTKNFRLLVHYQFMIRSYIYFTFKFYSLTIIIYLIPEISLPFTVRTEICPSRGEAGISRIFIVSRLLVWSWKMLLNDMVLKIN